MGLRKRIKKWFKETFGSQPAPPPNYLKYYGPFMFPPTYLPYDMAAYYPGREQPRRRRKRRKHRRRHSDSDSDPQVYDYGYRGLWEDSPDRDGGRRKRMGQERRSHCRHHEARRNPIGDQRRSRAEHPKQLMGDGFGTPRSGDTMRIPRSSEGNDQRNIDAQGEPRRAIVAARVVLTPDQASALRYVINLGGIESRIAMRIASWAMVLAPRGQATLCGDPGASRNLMSISQHLDLCRNNTSKIWKAKA
ncbi:hypothetical protein M011DRAFT_457623 [Sporormia fimetaria CBS 119925]|uniref:Uncharacterized protein n=1 Tax=Sporormia fimetaria CBS 119925 TaxID=1340428 RepID=A0A6A6VFD2_9PLEO|nr:hypothetical protein M011DRAFT_457623 [Sporormia fimetaria CBS 119925]